MTKEVKEFQTQFHKTITFKKRAPKDLVKQLHDKVAANLCIRKMSNSEYRSIDLYFKHFTQYSHAIIPALKVEFEKLIMSDPIFKTSILKSIKSKKHGQSK